MHTSARNQFHGTITAIQPGAVNDEIDITLAGGQQIVAVVTRSSTASLGLAVGVEAFALVKASWIILVTDSAGVRLSARNQLAGTIAKVTTGAVNAEVILTLEDGNEVVAIVTNDSVGTLGLAIGQRASAVFKASSVIVGVKA